MLMLVSFNAAAYNPVSSVLAGEFDYDLKLEEESIQEDLTGPFIICSMLMTFYIFFDILETGFGFMSSITSCHPPSIWYYLAVFTGTMASALENLAVLAGCQWCH